MVVAPGRLLERERELERLGRLLDAAQAGSGAFAVVTASPGIGKTRLLHALREDAEERGLRVLAARGGELEREYAFGIVRQWFEPPLRTRAREKLLEGAAALAGPVVFGGELATSDSFSALHGLYWLCSNVANQAPIVLSLDDAHWSDDASLRFVNFLVRRLADLPVLVVASVREPAEGLVAELAADTSVERLRLHALGPEGVAAFLRDRTDGGPVDDEFALACLEATGGNPFLLGELARALAEADVPLTAAAADSVAATAPASVAAAVLVRLSRLGPDATRLAQALAVAGDGATLSLAAALARLPEDDGAALADALARADVFAGSRPLRFAHPIVRSAIYDALGASERHRLHERAAALLRDRGARPDAVAVHVLATEPRADKAAVDTLVEAAHDATARGAPEAAASLLSRAVAEPPSPERRSQILLELGQIEHALERPAAVSRLREAHALARGPYERARAALALAWAMGPTAADQEGLIPVLERSIEAVAPSDRELALELEAARLNAAWVNPALVAKVAPRAERFAELEGRTPGECLLLAYLARVRMDLGRPATDVGPLAERAALGAAAARVPHDSFWLLHTGVILRQAERIDVALELLDRALAEAETRGSVRAFVMASMFRSAVLHRAGDIRGAEADARAAFDAAVPGTWNYLPAVACLVDALVEQARLDEAAELLAEHDLTHELPDTRPGTVLLFSRAWLRAEQGELAASLADLAAARSRLDRAGHVNIAGLDGRVRKVSIHLATGDADAATREAGVAVEVARSWGTSGMLGIALRAQGLATRDVELLRQAVGETARSPLRVEHARSLLELGAAVRRRGERRAAREPLREAVALAEECDAALVRERAREELAATGVRVRRDVRSGVEALTPSERRIVERAASGASNPEIAQALFVTVKTVEMHLGNAYRKLGISSRHELASAIAAPVRATRSRAADGRR